MKRNTTNSNITPFHMHWVKLVSSSPQFGQINPLWELLENQNLH